MTEASWLASTDPTLMLKFLRGKASNRKLRLLACAFWWATYHERFSGGIHLARRRWAEAWIDRGAPRGDLNSLPWASDVPYPSGSLPAREWHVLHPNPWEAIQMFLVERVAQEQAILLRDIFGNPFRPVATAPAILRWNDACVVKIAEAAYKEGNFFALPILADALEDAGCDNDDILRHCREPGEHARGCWVVDQILGKE